MTTKEVEVWRDRYPLFTMAVIEEALPTKDPVKVADALAMMERIYPELHTQVGFSIAHDWPRCPVYQRQVELDDTIRIDLT